MQTKSTHKDWEEKETWPPLWKRNCHVNFQEETQILSQCRELGCNGFVCCRYWESNSVHFICWERILGLTYTPSPIPCLSLIFNFQAGPHCLAELTLNLLCCTDRPQPWVVGIPRTWQHTWLSVPYCVCMIRITVHSAILTEERAGGVCRKHTAALRPQRSGAGKENKLFPQSTAASPPQTALWRTLRQSTLD